MDKLIKEKRDLIDQRANLVSKAMAMGSFKTIKKEFDVLCSKIEELRQKIEKKNPKHSDLHYIIKSKLKIIF